MNLTQELLIIIGVVFIIYWSYWLYKNRAKLKAELKDKEWKNTNPTNQPTQNIDASNVEGKST